MGEPSISKVLNGNEKVNKNLSSKSSLENRFMQISQEKVSNKPQSNN